MRRSSPRGYALIAALILLMIASLGVVEAVQRAELDAQREREAALLFAGDQYRQALASFYSHVPKGGVPQYPEKLQDLLADTRFPTVVRHLRRLYPDPMTSRPDWGLMLSAGRIVGVYSRSVVAPLRHANFPPVYSAFAEARTYADWKFGTVTVASGAGEIANAGAGASTPGSSGTGGPGSAPGTAQPAPPVATHCNSDYGQALQACSRLPLDDRRPCLVQASHQLQACVAAGGQ